MWLSHERETERSGGRHWHDSPRPVLHESCGPLSTCQHALPCMPASKPVSAYVCVLPPGTESREALSREPRPDETRRGRKRGRQLPVGSACAPRNTWPRGNPEARSGLVKRASALASTVHSPGGGVAHEGLGGRCGDGCAQFLASLMGLNSPSQGVAPTLAYDAQRCRLYCCWM